MSDGRLMSLREALSGFVDATETQSQAHIRRLHWHVAARLVIEGGFLPDEIMPRPPLRAEAVRGDSFRLTCDPQSALSGERTVLGGLKTKQVDVVVAKDGIGPCVAVSIKGTQNAFRNLTNRMEEAIGDCTNLHITYPALVYGFLHVLRANREGEVPHRNDIALHLNSQVGEDIKRYHAALSGLTGRLGVRNDFTRYEAVALALAEMGETARGQLFDRYPEAGSPLALERFFPALYQVYDMRFVFGAPALGRQTRRKEWILDGSMQEIAALTELVPRIG